MALTVLLLQQIMQSEVENLHTRIDEHRTLIDKIFDKLDSIDRQLSLLWLAVEDLKVEVAAIRQDMVTKADLDAALANYATKADVHSIVQAALADYPTKADVQTIVETTVEAMFAKYFPALGS